MTNNWIEIAISTTVVVGELLYEFLETEGAKGVIMGEWASGKKSEYTVVKAYFLEDTKNIDELIGKISQKLDFYSESGLNKGSGEIVSKVVNEDSWANAWKAYFKTFKIGKNLIVKPLWDKYKPKKKDLVIDFDPGMAFGSGAHPSTHLCMEKLEEMASGYTDKKNCNVLDLGTGSGILAITLSLLGFEKITAIDIDLVSIRASEENFRINKNNINLFQGELKDCKETYDLIVGNLLAEIIENIAGELYKKINKGGIFMGSGIIRRKEDDVTSALINAGFELIEKKYMENWVLLLFRKI